MALWKDSNGTLHDDMDGTALALQNWPQDCVQISDDEAAQILSAQNPPDPNADIKAQIAALEAQQTDRRVRESALGIDAGWLSNLNSQIAELRAQLV